MAPSSVIPLYQQIYIAIRDDILAGHYTPDEALPGENLLAEQYNVSRVTIRKTLSELESEGLIDRVHGVGTFPVALDDRRLRIRNSIDSLYDLLSHVSAGYKNEILRFEIIDSAGFLRAKHVDFGEKSLLIICLSKIKGRPVHLYHQYLPERLAQHIDRRELVATRSSLIILKRKGVVSADTELFMSAAAANIESSRLLKVPVGSPLISLKRVSRDGDGRPIEYFEALSRSDEYVYKFGFKGSGPDNFAKWAG